MKHNHELNCASSWMQTWDLVILSQVLTTWPHRYIHMSNEILTVNLRYNTAFVSKDVVIKMNLLNKPFDM